MSEDFKKGYIFGIKVENENAIRTLEETLYELQEKRKNGEVVIGYWSIKRYIEDIIEKMKIGGK